MSVVVTPSARETFMPRELSAAYKDFTKRGPQYPNGETGLRAAAYRFGDRVLIVYEESETGVVVLMSDSRILDNPLLLSLRTDTDASNLRKPISPRPQGLPVLTSQSALRLSITTSR